MTYKSPYGTELKFTHPIDVKAHNASVAKSSERMIKKNPEKRKSFTKKDFEREMSSGDSFRDVNRNTAKSHALKK